MTPYYLRAGRGELQTTASWKLNVRKLGDNRNQLKPCCEQGVPFHTSTATRALDLSSSTNDKKRRPNAGATGEAHDSFAQLWRPMLQATRMGERTEAQPQHKHEAPFFNNFCLGAPNK